MTTPAEKRIQLADFADSIAIVVELRCVLRRESAPKRCWSSPTAREETLHCLPHVRDRSRTLDYEGDSNVCAEWGHDHAAFPRHLFQEFSAAQNPARAHSPAAPAELSRAQKAPVNLEIV